MAVGALVEDAHSNLSAVAHREVTGGREYEFVFPPHNQDEGDTAWERGRAYQIAFLVGEGPTFRGVTPGTWMSDQILIRIGERSRVSIYHPPFLPRARDERPHGHDRERHGPHR